MIKKYQLTKVFTPSCPARLTYVDREKINNRVVRALELPGTQIVVYGHTGSGKTTLLENILHRVYSKHIKTNCMVGMSFEQIVVDAFDQLNPFYCAEQTKKEKTKVDASLTAGYKTIKLQLAASTEEESSSTEKRVLPLQLSTQNLAKFIGSIKACWVLEDFHKIADAEKTKFAQMMKVFTDLSDEYPELKIIAIGAVNTARQVIRFDKEMSNRIAEIQVDLMSSNEIKQIIEKGSTFLNVVFEGALIDEITHNSNGLASICHKLCYLICDAENIKETLEQEFTISYDKLDEAISEHIADNSDSMKADFDRAYKRQNAEPVLRVLSNGEHSGQLLASILESLKSSGVNHTEKTISSVLEDLQKEEFGSNVIFDPESAKYSFSSPFFAAFARGVFQQIDSRSFKNSNDKAKAMAAIFNDVLQSFIKKSLQQSLFDTPDTHQDSGLIVDPR